MRHIQTTKCTKGVIAPTNRIDAVSAKCIVSTKRIPVVPAPAKRIRPTPAKRIVTIPSPAKCTKRTAAYGVTIIVKRTIVPESTVVSKGVVVVVVVAERVVIVSTRIPMTKFAVVSVPAVALLEVPALLLLILVVVVAVVAVTVPIPIVAVAPHGHRRGKKGVQAQ